MEDRSGRFLRWVDDSEIDSLLARDLVVMEGSGRRCKLVLKSNRLARDFEGALSIAAINGQQKTTYEERYEQHPCPVVVLKRYDTNDGRFKVWDENLTFEEARRGQMLSKQTKDAIRAARRMREPQEQIARAA